MDAEVRIGADASDLERTAAAAKTAWDNASKGIAGAFGTAAQSIVRGLGDVVLAQGRINFSAQLQQVRDFEQGTARMAVATGRDLEEVRRSAERIGVEIGKRPSEVIAWENAVGRLTYNFKGAGDSIKAFAGFAAQTGRSVEDYQNLAVALDRMGVHGDKAADVLGRITAQAKETSVAGGPAALADQFEALSDTLTYFANTGPASVGKITGAMAEFGKNFSNPQVAGRVGQQVFGSIASDPLGWSRVLGHDIYNQKTGEVDNPVGTLREITENIKKRYGKNAFRALAYQFGGTQSAAALYNADWSKVKTLGDIAPTGAAHEALGQYLGTDAGKRDVAGAKLEESSRALLGSSTLLGHAADALQRFASEHPITSSFGAQLAGNLIPAMFGKNALGGFGGSGIGGIAGGALGSFGGAGRALGAVGALAGAFGGGYGFGSWIDQETGFSDWVGTSGKYRLREEAKADVARNAALSGRVASIRQTNAAIRGMGLEGAEGGLVVNTAAELGVKNQAVTADSLREALKAKGMSDEEAERLGAAFAKALLQIKLKVEQPPDTPINVTVKTSKSSAAGGQHGG